MSFYTPKIQSELARHGAGSADPRHVEAFMRLAHGTLDGLSSLEFANEVIIALDCIELGGVDGAESLAQSFAL